MSINDIDTEENNVQKSIKSTKTNIRQSHAKYKLVAVASKFCASALYGIWTLPWQEKWFERSL